VDLSLLVLLGVLVDLAIQRVLDFLVGHQHQEHLILLVVQANLLVREVLVVQEDQVGIFGMVVWVVEQATKCHRVLVDLGCLVGLGRLAFRHDHLVQECLEVQSGIGNNCLVVPELAQNLCLAVAAVVAVDFHHKHRQPDGFCGFVVVVQ